MCALSSTRGFGSTMRAINGHLECDGANSETAETWRKPHLLIKLFKFYQMYPLIIGYGYDRIDI